MSTSGSPSTTTTPRTNTAQITARRARERRVVHVPAVIAVALLLLTAAACGSDATLTETASPAAQTQADTPTTTAAATEPTPAPEPTTAPEPAETTPKNSPSAALRQANAAWRAQDWAELAAFATPDVVAVAQASGSPDDEGPLELVGDNLANAWRCSLDGGACTDGLWSCEAGGMSCSGEILYGYEPDADCCAAIYLVTIADSGNGFTVTDLSFAGDAG